MGDIMGAVVVSSAQLQDGEGETEGDKHPDEHPVINVCADNFDSDSDEL